jgi:abortive infection bacteriophage resistance protein
MVQIIIITNLRQVGYYKISIFVNEWLQYEENEKAAAL